MDIDCPQSSDPAPASGCLRALLASLLVLAMGWAGVATAAPPAVRLPKGELAGEYWDLIARLDSGHLVIAQTAVSNLGPGDRHAVAFGHLIDPDGTVHRFKRSEPEGKWTLAGGQRLDLRSIALDPAGSPRRFEVARDEVGIDLALPRRASPVRATDAGPCSFELLEPAAPASARLRVGAGGKAFATQGRVALTHRWSASLESDCVLRRVEVFVLEREIGIYFSETTTPEGAVSRRLVAERDGRVLFAGDPGDAPVGWSVEKGFAPPESLRFAVGGVSGRVRFGATLASVDPTERLPAAVQWLVSARTRPRLSWLRAPFELEVAGRTIRGEAVAKVTYSNPLSTRVAAHSEE